MKPYHSALMAALFCTVAPQVPAQTNLGLGLQLQGGVQAGLSITGAVGTLVEIQYTSDLAQTNNWLHLAGLTLPASPYLYLDPIADGTVSRFYRAVVATNMVPTNMSLIPAGSYTMGNCMDPYEGSDDELPTNTVSVSAFFMDKYEVTKALWDEVVAFNGGNGYSYETDSGLGKAANHPVQKVSWYDCVKWCNARSQKENLTPCYYTDVGLTTIYKTGQVTNPFVNWSANGYRLPTEAEWEKAARGGTSGHRFPWSDSENIQHSRANYRASENNAYDLSYPAGYHPTFATNSTPYTSPAGYFAPNGYDLYDMAGNVFEWCWDWYGGYGSDAQTDPPGPTSGSNRVNRGGGWGYEAPACRTAYRASSLPSSRFIIIGFRCARTAGQ